MKNNNFARKIFFSQIKSNGLAAVAGALMITLFLNVILWELPYLGIIFSGLWIFFQWVFAPFSNKLVSSRLSKSISEWKKTGFHTEKSSTFLIEKLMRFPAIKGIETFLVFTLCAGALPLILYFLPAFSITKTEIISTIITGIYSAYMAGIIILYTTEKICSEISQQIFLTGVDKEYVRQKKYFGLNTKVRYILFLIIPAVYANLLMFVMLYQGYANDMVNPLPAWVQLFRMSLLTIVIVFICIFIGILYYRQLNTSNDKLTKTISHLLSNKDKNTTFPSALNDPLQYNIFLLNNSVQRYNSLISQADEISSNIQKTTEELSVISQEVESTSINQNSDVNEIVQTVNQTNELSMTIQNNIEEVSQRINQTNIDVTNSFSTLDQSIQQITNIQNTNKQIIEGIKNLTRLIDSIDNVISMMKDISNQTKIIAMNAELEAVSAKDEGKSFHIIANEIQQLQENSVSSIKDIQTYLESVKNSSLVLIQSSENGTKLIEEQKLITEELKNHFEGIRSSSEDTNDKTEKIKEIIKEQTVSFSQIVTTLAEISNGFQNFTESTKEISTQADRMMMASEKLSCVSSELDWSL